MKLTPQKLEEWGYHMVKFHNPNLTVLTRDCNPESRDCRRPNPGISGL